MYRRFLQVSEREWHVKPNTHAQTVQVCIALVTQYIV